MVSSFLLKNETNLTYPRTSDLFGIVQGFVEKWIISLGGVRHVRHAPSSLDKVVALRMHAISLSTLFGSFQTTSPDPAGARRTERGSPGQTGSRAGQPELPREDTARMS